MRCNLCGLDDGTFHACTGMPRPSVTAGGEALACMDRATQLARECSALRDLLEVTLDALAVHEPEQAAVARARWREVTRAWGSDRDDHSDNVAS